MSRMHGMQMVILLVLRLSGLSAVPALRTFASSYGSVCSPLQNVSVSERWSTEAEFMDDMRSVITALEPVEGSNSFRKEILHALHGVVPEDADLSDFMLGMGEFMLRHPDDAQVQHYGARAIAFLANFLGRIWWPARQAAASEIAGFEKVDSTPRVDVSSAVAAVVCAWQRHWASPAFGTNTEEADRVTVALYNLVSPKRTVRPKRTVSQPFVIGWWSQPNSSGRLPVALQSATIMSVLTGSVTLRRGGRNASLGTVVNSCVILEKSTPIIDRSWLYGSYVQSPVDSDDFVAGPAPVSGEEGTVASWADILPAAPALCRVLGNSGYQRAIAEEMNGFDPCGNLFADLVAVSGMWKFLGAVLTEACKTRRILPNNFLPAPDLLVKAFALQSSPTEMVRYGNASAFLPELFPALSYLCGGWGVELALSASGILPRATVAELSRFSASPLSLAVLEKQEGRSAVGSMIKGNLTICEPAGLGSGWRRSFDQLVEPYMRDDNNLETPDKYTLQSALDELERAYRNDRPWARWLGLAVTVLLIGCKCREIHRCRQAAQASQARRLARISAAVPQPAIPERRSARGGSHLLVGAAAASAGDAAAVTAAAATVALAASAVSDHVLVVLWRRVVLALASSASALAALRERLLAARLFAPPPPAAAAGAAALTTTVQQQATPAVQQQTAAAEHRRQQLRRRRGGLGGGTAREEPAPVVAAGARGASSAHAVEPTAAGLPSPRSHPPHPSADEIVVGRSMATARGSGSTHQLSAASSAAAAEPPLPVAAAAADEVDEDFSSAAAAEEGAPPPPSSLSLATCAPGAPSATVAGGASRGIHERLDEDDSKLCCVCLVNPKTAGLVHGESMHKCLSLQGVRGAVGAGATDPASWLAHAIMPRIIHDICSSFRGAKQLK